MVVAGLDIVLYNGRLYDVVFQGGHLGPFKNEIVCILLDLNLVTSNECDCLVFQPFPK